MRTNERPWPKQTVSADWPILLLPRERVVPHMFMIINHGYKAYAIISHKLFDKPRKKEIVQSKNPSKLT